ncbi:DUF3221 domain-containing protein [Halobacillus fulvus]|nr:DUF3221 domain-containing protein [Halobacillus fulvus]
MRVIVSIVIALTLLGCSGHDRPMEVEGIEGEIVQINSNEVIVMSRDLMYEIKVNDATTFEGATISEVEKGQSIKVWYVSEPLDSNPVKATASRIIIR